MKFRKKKRLARTQWNLKKNYFFINVYCTLKINKIFNSGDELSLAKNRQLPNSVWKSFQMHCVTGDCFS